MSTVTWIFAGLTAFCVIVGILVMVLAICKISGRDARREEAEEVERLIQEGWG